MNIPFCQPRVLDFARQLPLEHRLFDGKYKRIVYEAAKALIPQSIMDRKKQPFTLPVVAMIKNGTKLFDFMESVFSQKAFKERGYSPVSAVRQTLTILKNPRCFSVTHKFHAKLRQNSDVDF